MLCVVGTLVVASFPGTLGAPFVLTLNLTTTMILFLAWAVALSLIALFAVAYIMYRQSQSKAEQAADIKEAAATLETMAETAEVNSDNIAVATSAIVDVATSAQQQKLAFLAHGESDAQAHMWLAEHLTLGETTGALQTMGIKAKTKVREGWVLFRRFITLLEESGFILYATFLRKEGYGDFSKMYLVFDAPDEMEGGRLAIETRIAGRKLQYLSKSEGVPTEVDLSSFTEAENFPFEGEVITSGDITIHTFSDCQEECRIGFYGAVAKALTSCILYPVRPAEDYLTVYRPVVANDGLTRFASKVPRPSLHPDVMNLSYPGVTLEGVSISFQRLLEKLPEIVARQRINVVVSGQTGSGKSTLAKAMMGAFPSRGMLYLIEDHHATGNLPLLLQSNDPTVPVLVVIEDAHHYEPASLATLFSVMEGAASLENVSFVVLYNEDEASAEIKQLISALSRPGRASAVLQLAPLGQEEATKLTNAIATFTGKSPAIPLSGPGPFSLAQVWSQFPKGGLADILRS